MTSSVPVCPVPKEQQPLQEYQDLKESWFFGWATLDLIRYIRPFLILWGMGCILIAPIALVSFPFSKEPLHCSLSTAAGASILPLLVLFRLYLGWQYVRGRLDNKIVIYEESGWYDGQTWEKPIGIVQRDRLIVAYQIQPILNRLKYSFLIIGLCFASGCFIWWFSDLL